MKSKDECNNCTKCETLKERSKNQRAAIKMLQEQLRQKQDLLLAFATNGAGAVLTPTNINMTVGSNNENRHNITKSNVSTMGDNNRNCSQE